jgi:CDP-diacylglycerol--glycerol-3-phosphate 3-phosphatidyltransferase
MKMTTANLVTLIRISMIPIYMIVYALCGNTSLLAVAIFILASATDALDGYIARHYNQVTDFGKFVDPLADKLLILAALLMLTSDGIMPAWCGMVVLTREFVISSLRMVAASKGIVIAAAKSGKIKAVTQVVCTVILMLTLRDFALIGSFTLGDLAVWVMAASALISGVDYMSRNFNVIKEGVMK